MVHGILRSHCPVISSSPKGQGVQTKSTYSRLLYPDEAKLIGEPDESLDVGTAKNFKEVQAEHRKDLLELKTVQSV